MNFWYRQKERIMHTYLYSYYACNKNIFPQANKFPNPTPHTDWLMDRLNINVYTSRFTFPSRWTVPTRLPFRNHSPCPLTDPTRSQWIVPTRCRWPIPSQFPLWNTSVFQYQPRSQWLTPNRSPSQCTRRTLLQVMPPPTDPIHGPPEPSCGNRSKLTRLVPCSGSEYDYILGRVPSKLCAVVNDVLSSRKGELLSNRTTTRKLSVRWGMVITNFQG